MNELPYPEEELKLQQEANLKTVKYLISVLDEGMSAKHKFNMIHATLFVNFVYKKTDGIQITNPPASTHELMMQVLQAYSQQRKQSTPVKTTEECK